MENFQPNSFLSSSFSVGETEALADCEDPLNLLDPKEELLSDAEEESLAEDEDEQNCIKADDAEETLVEDQCQLLPHSKLLELEQAQQQQESSAIVNNNGGKF